MKLKIFSALILILVCIQFVNNNTNTSNGNTQAIWNKYPMSDEVRNKLRVACLDCHSNQTEYPWYASIQPMEYWLSRHINGGKKHLNFSEFLSYPKKKQLHKLDETVEMIEKGEMPLKSYTYFGLHPEANLSAEDRTLLIDWAKSVKGSIEIAAD